MSSYLPKILKISLTAIWFIAACNIARAQDRFQSLAFKIDSFANVGLPKSALAEVDKLELLARDTHNSAQQIKAAIYRMTFQSYLEEDALASIITRLKQDIGHAEYPVKPVLQSLLAGMYWNYYQQNRYQFTQRSRLEHPGDDFTKWDLQTMLDQTGRLYQLSLIDLRREQQTSISILDGVLAGDSSTRYLRPTLYDLLTNRALDYFLTDEASLTKPKMPFSVNNPDFFKDSRTFIYLKIRSTDTVSPAYTGLRYLQEASAFHLNKGDDEALADLDLKRLMFLHNKATFSAKDSLYLSALKQIAADFVNKPISADALVLTGQYYQQRDSLIIAHHYFDLAKKAYPASLGGRNAVKRIDQIEAKSVSATVENENIPGKPLLALATYKNVSKANVSLYRLSENQLKEYLSTNNGRNSYQEQLAYKLAYVQKRKPAQKQLIDLPGTSDYRNHSAEFKLDALLPGNYVLVIDDAMAADNKIAQISNFKITKLAYTARGNPDQSLELLVADRETGKPLQGVKITILQTYFKGGPIGNKYNSTRMDTAEYGKSDKEGKFISGPLNRGASVIELKLKGDTLSDLSKNIIGAQVPYDNELPYDKTVFFTDRQIYRPGQTIYFKALQLQIFKGNKSKISPAKAITIELKDANNKQINLLNLTTNDFGSVSGSFVLPVNMLNGNLTLKTEDGEITVNVEEYKRPTFQVTFLPVTSAFKLKDSVIVKGNVSAFSGYGISNAKVIYHVTRSLNNPYRFGRSTYGPIYNGGSSEIKSDTIVTDNRGDFLIKFLASPDENIPERTANYRYSLSADVTDASGETRSANTSVTVGYNNILIINDLPTQIFAKDSLKVPVSISNLNGQPQSGDVHIKIFALQNPDHLFKTRLWPTPDQVAFSSEEFKRYFPEYAYKKEDDQATWPVLNQVADLNLKADEKNAALIPFDVLGKQVSGVYKVMISAKNNQGDTTSVVKYVNLISDPSKPASYKDWVIPVLNAVRPGRNASFLVGTGEVVNVLMERYNGAQLLSSKWIKIEKEQKAINFPISDTDKDPAVQFMMIRDNRIYTSYQKITIIRPDQSLKLKWLTFRNLLQPGEKEQWQLQLTGAHGEKQDAEILAALYDASLYDIADGSHWKGILNGDNDYEPNYFAWNDYDFIRSAGTQQVHFTYRNSNPQFRDYEHLNLFGYSYYGGYNNGYRNYLNIVKNNIAKAENDKKLQDAYVKNASLVNAGYDVSGYVKASDDMLPMAGASIIIKGTQINTITNSKGFFHIKVPVNDTLAFRFIGYVSKETAINKNQKLDIILVLADQDLNEVSVIGYGVATSKATLGMTVNLRGIVRTDTVEYKASAPQARLNGKDYNAGYFSEDVLKKIPGLQIVDDYGDQANMVGIKSGEPTQMLNIATHVPIPLRKNFNETAFFYPQLRTNEKGEVLIEFTMPEALTRWKFRAFAHTRALQTGYLENTVVTQKQLSISANMPRFLREGDTVTVSARLANLTTGMLKGQVNLRLFNALNMQPVKLLANPADSLQNFEVAATTTKAISFQLIIPPGLDALTYRLTAEAGNYSDGEENTIPVLPNRMLVTESMPMMVRAGQSKAFTFDKLINQHSSTLKSKALTLEYTQNPAWYAVQALPYMMEFPYECSEQTFSRYYANSLATNLVNQMPVIKQVFDRWKMANSGELLSNLQKNEDLKATLIEETPWLQDAASETEQKNRIALLFDLNKMSTELALNLEKLKQKQLPDGGFPWFAGDHSDSYITRHILAGIGQLYQSNIADADNPVLEAIANKALDFTDNELLASDAAAEKLNNYTTREPNATEIHAWYARSYFKNNMSAELKTVFSRYLKRAETHWVTAGIYEQGMIALTMLRSSKTEVAEKIIRSLQETAQQSDDLGMYWSKNQLGYYWYQSPIETQCLMIELFTEAGGRDKAVQEMKIWLLRNKQTGNWKTTKATAAACYALLMKNDNLLSTENGSVIRLGGKNLDELKPDTKADAGTGYIKTSWTDEAIKPDLGKVEITNKSKSISWGALHWQYLEQLDKITPSHTEIQLERKYFIVKEGSSGKVLTEADNHHQPKVGDLLKVVVYLKAGRDFEYVQLKDLRPAGTEPVDALSSWKYQDGLYYYQVTKDVATNFFISNLNKGSYVFEYRLRVAQPGRFSTGITTVQSMYAPEFNAHAEGRRIGFVN